MKLFIHVNSFEKVVCEIVAFLSREGWVETCFVVSLWVNHACIFCFVQCFLHPRSAGMLKLGQRVDAFMTQPWQRRCGSVAQTGRRGTAKLQPGIRLLRTRGMIMLGPSAQCWVLNWFCLASWDPFLTHQRCRPCCATLVCEYNDDLYIF